MRKSSLLLCFALFLPTVASAQYTGPAAGQKVAFLGDSITAFGWGKPAGYVQLVSHALELEGKKIEVIPAGVGGNTSKDMLARVDKDVIAKKPDWMTLSCGVNDVWHGDKGVVLDEYQKNITEIVTKAQAAGIKVVILTATMITEDQSAANNQRLIPYNEFLRSLAKEKGLPLVDLNAAMQAALAQEKAKLPDFKGNFLTLDGVHMTPVGDQMMATAILKTWGVTDDQIAQATQAWGDLDCTVQLVLNPSLKVSQYLQLRSLAASQGTTIDALVSDAVKKDLETLLSAAPPATVPTTPAATPSTNAPPAKP